MKTKAFSLIEFFVTIAIIAIMAALIIPAIEKSKRDKQAEKEEAPAKPYITPTTIIVDHCEYLEFYGNNHFMIVHKGNCTNHNQKDQ